MARSCVNNVSLSLSYVSALPFIMTNFRFYYKGQTHNKMLMDESREQATGWENQKGKLRRKFTVLNDEDLNFTERQKSEMLLKLSAKLGLSVGRLQIIMEGEDTIL